MLGINSFSDLLSHLNPGLHLGPPLEQQAEEPTAEQAPSRGTVDVLELTSLPSDVSGASFGTEPVVSQEPRIYRPTSIQAGRFGLSMNVEFNLSIERQATFAQPEESGGGRAVFNAVESASLFYQSEFATGRNSLSGNFGEVRRYQADLFYNRTRELSARLESEVGDRFASTGQRVARSFEIEISLSASFLGQFTGQSETISDLDSGLFEQYLNRTDAVSGQGGQALQSFFDEVDRILSDTESLIQDSLNSFFDDVKASFGLSDAETAALREQVVDEVEAFFNDVDTFLDDMRGTLIAPESGEVLPEGEGVELLV